MYRYLRVIFFVMLFAHFASCKKDFLSVPDKTNVIKQAYVTDLKTTGDYLNGIYVELALRIGNGYNCIYFDLVADDVKPSSNVLSAHYKWEQKADDSRALVLSASSLNMNAT